MKSELVGCCCFFSTYSVLSKSVEQSLRQRDVCIGIYENVLLFIFYRALPVLILSQPPKP